MTESLSDHNQQVIKEFHANNGTMPNGQPLLLLTTRGAKSGKTRVNPVVYFRDGERYVIFASKAGAPTNPDWYHNLLANPEVTVEVGPQTFVATAVVVEGAERDRLFGAQVAAMPFFGDYQTKTSRQIPVVILEPKPSR